VTVITPVFIWRTPFAGVVGFVLAAAVVMGPALWLMLRAADTGIYRPDLSGIKEQLRFAVPLGLAGMIGQLSINLDKILVSKYFDPEIFAVYVNGAMEIPLIGMITGSATAVLLPDITRMLGAGNNEEALELWKRAAVKCALIIFPVMGFLMVMATELMSLLYGAKYVASAVPFRIYLLLLPIRIAFFGTIFMGAGRSDVILKRTAIGFVINLGLSVLLIRVVGYLGAAMATVMTVYFCALPINAYMIKKITGISLRQCFPWLMVMKILLCVSVAGLVVSLFNRVVEVKLEFYALIAGTVVFMISIATLYQLASIFDFQALVNQLLRKKG
jgi:O-antigen/teichoic acid export membrane protein